jgi:hypothetical protein
MKSKISLFVPIGPNYVQTQKLIDTPLALPRSIDMTDLPSWSCRFDPGRPLFVTRSLVCLG